jgi:hypothetical protein
VKHLKNLTRMGNGWGVRIQWKGRAYAQFFSDAQYGGKLASRRKAVLWRDRMERQIGKPRTESQIRSAGVLPWLGKRWVRRKPKGRRSA